TPKNRFSFAEKGGNLTFELPDTKTFRCLGIAYEAIKRGGNAPCVMNAANEIAVEAFLNGKIPFLGIPDVIEKTLEKVGFQKSIDIDSCFATDSEARKIASEIIG
ncbi:MAG: 1-deoxy-D-xylulose-5-phosphate reductoisomerase, partial [Bacteroidales bacterium]|nr:1-deoxy-D-xylulose-5-phosphate reductoisomerase [Bacteroidales bacterium]